MSKQYVMVLSRSQKAYCLDTVGDKFSKNIFFEQYKESASKDVYRWLFELWLVLGLQVSYTENIYRHYASCIAHHISLSLYVFKYCQAQAQTQAQTQAQ